MQGIKYLLKKRKNEHVKEIMINNKKNEEILTCNHTFNENSA